MTTCGQITRAGMVLLVAAAIAVPGCGFISGLLGGGEPAPTKAISDLILPAEQAETLAQEHFVTRWLVLGPFTFAEDDFGGDQQQAAAASEFMPDEQCLNGTQEAPAETAWTEKQFEATDSPGQIDLDAMYDSADHAAAYAVAWLHSAEEITDARLLMGSDDYIVVWINGKKVHTYDTERRAGEADQDTIEGIVLKKGYNRVVVKCVDVVLGWNFFFRLTDKAGKAIAVRPRPAAVE